MHDVQVARDTVLGGGIVVPQVGAVVHNVPLAEVCRPRGQGLKMLKRFKKLRPDARLVCFSRVMSDRGMIPDSLVSTTSISANNAAPKDWRNASGREERRMSAMLQRPISGGVFGDGRYALATMPAIVNGLHAVAYLVVEPRDGAVLSVADEGAGSRRRATPTAPVGAELDLCRAGLAARATVPERRAIFWRGEGRCHYCSTALQVDGCWHAEHQVPLALGGDDAPLSLVPSCPRCGNENHREPPDKTIGPVQCAASATDCHSI